MKIQSYNRELATATAVFSKLFRNISITRKLEDGTESVCKIPLVIGSRSRIIKAFEAGEQSPAYTLPMIAISRTGLNRNPQRLSNLHNEVKLSTNGKINYDLYTPVPIDINFRVTILAKYFSDVDMILSNFLIFFNDDVWVSTTHPKFTDIRYYSQVILNNSITQNRTENISNSDIDLITTDLSFTFLTFIFGGTRQIKSGTSFYKRPVTTIVESEVVDENGEPTGETVASEIGEEETEIYDGFVPKITSINLELHAVPRMDPFRWIKDGSRINYDFIQYFEDVDNKSPLENDGRIYTNPEFDKLVWIIDDSTQNLKLKWEEGKKN